MSKLYTVSIVVPVYNGAGTISACLESLLSQNYPAEAYDIIVVENGSTDNTTQAVEKYPVRLFHSERRGPASARNYGISKGEADIIAFTDADCIAHPNWLAELTRPYLDPQIGGVGGTILAHDHANPTDVEMFSREHSPLINFVSGEGEFLPHLYTANASYRRDLLIQVGGFNPKMITGEDVDLSWRVQLQTGARLGCAAEAIVYHLHRSTRIGLARQYRQYGFGEILLDTLYGHYPGYPRNRRYQVQRILGQLAALLRYTLSAVLRQARRATGRATAFEALVPRLWLMIESNNILGKCEALLATRFMQDAQPVLNMDAGVLVGRFFQSRKE